MKPDTRPSYRYRAKAPVAPVTSPWPAGHFTELMRRHNWPPRFESQLQPADDGLHRSALASLTRMKYVLSTGNTGTILGLGVAKALQGDEARRKVLVHGAR